MIPLQTDGNGVLAHSWQGYPCFREKSKEDSCGMRDKRTSVYVCVCVRPVHGVCVHDFEEIHFLWFGVKRVHHAKGAGTGIVSVCVCVCVCV